MGEWQRGPCPDLSRCVRPSFLEVFFFSELVYTKDLFPGKPPPSVRMQCVVLEATLPSEMPVCLASLALLTGD